MIVEEQRWGDVMVNIEDWAMQIWAWVKEMKWIMMMTGEWGKNKGVRQLSNYLELLIKKKLKQQISDTIATPYKLGLASLRIELLKPFLAGVEKSKLGLASLRIGLLKPFSVGAEKNKLGLV